VNQIERRKNEIEKDDDSVERKSMMKLISVNETNQNRNGEGTAAGRGTMDCLKKMMNSSGYTRFTVSFFLYTFF
jgi:hypothetical protein